MNMSCVDNTPTCFEVSKLPRENLRFGPYLRRQPDHFEPVLGVDVLIAVGRKCQLLFVTGYFLK